MSVRNLVGRSVLSSDGAAVGRVEDIVFIPAEASAPATAPLHLAQGGWLALAVVEVGQFLGRSDMVVRLHITAMQWDAAFQAIILPETAATLRARLPPMAACATAPTGVGPEAHAAGPSTPDM